MEIPNSEKQPTETLFEICFVKGVEGPSIYLNDYRICGPKPWGGGQVVKSWKISQSDIENALNKKFIN